MHEPHDVNRLDFSRIAQDLQIRKVQVESVVQLLDEENTIPFITRYRKERTGGLDEELIRIIKMRVDQLRALAERKQTILNSIENQGRMTEELRHAILSADPHHSGSPHPGDQPRREGKHPDRQAGV